MSAIVVVFDKVPDVPVTVTVAFPGVAVLLADRVTVLVLVDGLGLNAAVMLFGNPVAEKVTLPEKPFSGTMEMELVPLAP